MKIITGTHGHLVMVKNQEKNESYPLPIKKVHLNCSPTGFSWGYGGSGPAQLAFAILFEITNDKEISLKLHQKFKWDVIAKFHTWFFILTSTQILKWINGVQNGLGVSELI